MVTKNIIFGVSEELYEHVRKNAYESRVSKAEICRLALRRYFDGNN
jgi:hypothetical protein